MRELSPAHDGSRSRTDRAARAEFRDLIDSGTRIATRDNHTTAPMFTSGGSYVICSIANISSVSQTVRIRLYDVGGNVSGDSGNFVLPARATQSWAAFGNGHCRFTTLNAKTLFRASIGVFEGGNVIASSGGPFRRASPAHPSETQRGAWGV